MGRAILCSIPLIFASVGVYGQSVEGQPAFEVAAIKPSPPPDGGRTRIGTSGGPGTSNPGQFSCQNCSLANLVTQAYGLKRYQLPAASSFESERFDIRHYRLDRDSQWIMMVFRYSQPAPAR